MLKKEIIWRELLYQAIEKKSFRTTQKELAEKFSYSLSTVFHSLRVPREIGAIEAGQKGIQVRDIKKFITLWASVRRLKKDICYKTHVSMNALELEKSMPSGVIWGAYSAYRLHYRSADLPAGYDNVYVYAAQPVEQVIRKRFPSSKKKENLVVLSADPLLVNYGKTTTIAHTLVDLWNMHEWYADEYYRALFAKIES